MLIKEGGGKATSLILTQNRFAKHSKFPPKHSKFLSVFFQKDGRVEGQRPRRSPQTAKFLYSKERRRGVKQSGGLFDGGEPSPGVPLQSRTDFQSKTFKVFVRLFSKRKFPCQGKCLRSGQKGKGRGAKPPSQSADCEILYSKKCMRKTIFK